MNVVAPLFLLAPLVLVPLGYRLLEVASPGSRPPAPMLRLVFPAAGSLVIAFLAPTGPLAGMLAAPWLAVTGATAVAAGVRWMRDPDRFRPGVRHATDAAVAFLAVGAVFAVTDRLGIQPFGFSTTIILLTAVHFHFAGFVLPLAGALAWTRRPSRRLEVALGAVVVGIPITALGFFGLPLANWTGAILTAGGGFGIGIATLAVARSMAKPSAVVLAVIAGASLLIAMPLAAIYATGTLTGAAWLGIDTMARVHGGLNALGFALPVIVAWTLDRRARTPIEPHAGARTGDDPRRLGLGAAAIVAGYACVVGLISAAAGANDPGPPEVVPRPVVLALLLMLPAAVAAIGAWRRSGPLLLAAGVLCLAQAFIAFSGVTLPFVVPAILLLALGGRTTAVPHPRRAALGALVVVALGVGSWFALLGTTEEVCWVARNGPNGELVYSQVPVTDSFTMGIDDVAAGCDGGTMTTRGIALAAILAIGAIAVAELSSRPAPFTEPPPDDLAPSTPFSDEVIRQGLPDPGGFSLADLRCAT